LGLPDDAFVVLFLGRQVQYKGLGTTVEAFRRLRARRPHAQLLVVGPETDFSHQLFEDLGNGNGISNLGRVSDDARLDALNACDCLVLPSQGEAFGIVFLEAWLMGKPVIGPRSAAVETVITDGRDGFLVPVGEPEAIEAALERWISRPYLAREMGARGRERVLERYTTQRIADIVEGVYLRTLRARSGEGPCLPGKPAEGR
jgi:glycosyltransferase involved in cell wall biosynthesis